MAYKQKINPRTGKFNLVPNGGGGEGGIQEVKSTDKSVSVSGTGSGVDLSVPLSTEIVDGRESSFSKLLRDHSFMNVIAVDSSQSFGTAAEANQSLMAADAEYYPIAGQQIRFVGNDGRMHDYRYHGNYLIDRNGTSAWWCGCTYDIANNVWLINANSNGSKMQSGRSASGMFWSVKDYPDSPFEKRTMMASASFGSVVMSGNSSAEYEFTELGGDETWISKKMQKTDYYHGVKRATILVGNVPTDVILFMSVSDTYYITSTLKDALYISQANVLRSLGYSLTVNGNGADMADEIEIFLDNQGRENVLILWWSNYEKRRSLTWARRTGSGWEEVSTYTFAINESVRKCQFKDGLVYCCVGDQGRTDVSSNAYVFTTTDEKLSLKNRYANTNFILPTPYGVVRVVEYKEVYVGGKQIQLPTTLTSSEFLTTFAYDEDKTVLLVTGGQQYKQNSGNYAFVLDVEKCKITNDADWEEIALVTEDHEGIITSHNGQIKAAQLDSYLDFDASASKLSVRASDRNTAYANYPCLGTDTDNGWCKVALSDIVDGVTKVYRDEACTEEFGTIVNHSYNPHNPNDLDVSIDGVSHRFVHIEDKTPDTIATTKALLAMSPSSVITEETIRNWGFTKNTGTITEVKFNGTSLATSGSADVNAAVNKRINGGTDLNTLLEPGFYHCASSHNCVNAHSTVNPFGLVVVHSALGDYYAQIIFDYWGKIYHRYKGGQSNTWTAWTERKIVTETDVSGWGFTKNAGTITEVKFNGTSLATSGSANIVAPVSKQLTNENLNNVNDPGIYFAGGGNACANIATTAGNAFGLVVAKTAGANYYQQTFYDYFGNEYKRFCKGGVWSAWVRQANANKNMVVNYEDGTSETFNLMVIQ